MDEDEKSGYEMILRDVFAVAALHGMYAAGTAYTGQTREDRARLAYDSAAAMMRERAKRIKETSPEKPKAP